MERQLPPEVDQVKNWCLKTRRFDDANFILTIKALMKNSQEVTPTQRERLIGILQMYALDNDLIDKIRERILWQTWGI